MQLSCWGEKFKEKTSKILMIVDEISCDIDSIRRAMKNSKFISMQVLCCDKNQNNNINNKNHEMHSIKISSAKGIHSWNNLQSKCLFRLMHS